MQAQVKNTEANEVIIHELKGDLRYFHIVEMKRTQVNEETKKETTQSKFSVAMGNQLISQPFETKKEAIQYLKTKPYEIIMAFVMRIVDYKTNNQNETK